MNKKTIAVRFQNGFNNKDYHYYVLDDYTYSVGDHVVVRVGGSAPELQVCRITATDVKSGNATKPIMCKVQTTMYNKWFGDEVRRAEIVTKLDLMERELEVNSKYQMLAKVNPKARALLTELEAL